MLSDTERRRVALAIADRRAWTTAHIPADLWEMVFLPLALLPTRAALRNVKLAVGILGEHRTTGQGINGFPIFASCLLLKTRDARAVLRYVRDFERQRQAMLTPREGSKHGGEVTRVARSRKRGQGASR